MINRYLIGLASLPQHLPQQGSRFRDEGRGDPLLSTEAPLPSRSERRRG
jgi:hypothetical protein